MHDLQPGFLQECQVCGSRDLKAVLDLGHQAPCDSLLWPRHLNEVEKTYPLKFLRCLSCGLAQINYVVSPEELFFLDYPYRSGITPSLVRNLQSTGPKVIERFEVPVGKLVIDIGSNDGTLLQGFKNSGMRVLGVEPTNIAKIAAGNGIETVQEFFTQDLASRLVVKYGKAAVITAANMFAHVAKLGGLIRGVDQLLEEGGLFVTESHYLIDLLETVQYDSIYHEHLKYYSVASLNKLFSFYDFTLVDVERITNYGGSIRVYARKGKGHTVSSSVAELCELESDFGLAVDQPWQLFADRVNRSRNALKLLVSAELQRGSRFVGIGCPGRAATLLNFCNLGPQELDYVAEQSSSLKLGLFTPGTHIPIVDEQQMFEEQPDFAILLAWHYWQPIVEKLRSRGLKSKIIIPLPEVEVLHFE
jgi:hypothetical protein